MKQSHKKLALLAAAVLCAGCIGGAASMQAKADAAVDISESYSFNDLPFHTGYSNFGYYDAGYVDYTMKIGLFDATAENYGLQAFDTWDKQNTLTLSTVSSLVAQNWQWKFGQNKSIVTELKSKITGTIHFDFSGCTLNGWFDWEHFRFSVYRYNAADQTLDTLVQIVKDSTVNAKDKAVYDRTVTVADGDVIYYEIGQGDNGNGYNIQNHHNAKIVVTPTAINQTVVNAYGKKLDAQVGKLVQANYATEDWEAIGKFVADFKAGTYADAGALVSAYEAAKSGIEAIKPDPLKDKRTALINAMNAYVGKLVEGNYKSENWTLITTAQSEFVTGAPACETEEALQELYDTKLAAIQAVKAYKQTFVNLDYPSKMNANGYDWIKGEIFDTKLYAGTANNLKEFDAQGSSQKIMYSTELNAGFDSPAYYVEDWKWYIGSNKGIITAYKANVDLKLTITNTYLADKHDSNGWTEETALTYYIVREGALKEIKVTNAPKKDEDFNGDFYLKAGDMLYIEFNSTIINEGDVRNMEAPCGTKVVADSTAFDAALYAEQNHDLAQNVVNLIAEKTAALREYYAGLKEEDYSATNWLTIGQYIDSFVEKCEKEVETEADVNALYESIFAEMKAVPSKTQAAAELKETLDGYVAELQAEYDKLVKDNAYTAENKTKLDEAFAAGKKAIEEAKSKTVGNQEKVKAIAAIKAVEAKPAKTEKGGCGSSLAMGAMTVVCAAAVALFAAKKKED